MAARKFDQERLDKLVEAARASERPYAALEGKPFNLSASVARTLVVGSGLSKSADEVVEREKARIARWLEQGHIGPAKARPKAPKTKAEPAPPADDVVAIPDEAAAAKDSAFANAEQRKRKARKDGQASDTAKAIAGNRKPVAATE